MGANLTGVWHGTYSYPLGYGMPDCHFVAVILHMNSALSGTVFETISGDFDISGDVNAALEGKLSADIVTFIKTYDGLNGWNHEVHYSGVLVDNGNEITGAWVIYETWGEASGTFMMIRKRSQTERVADTRQTKVEA